MKDKTLRTFVRESRFLALTEFPLTPDLQHNSRVTCLYLFQKTLFQDFLIYKDCSKRYSSLNTIETCCTTQSRLSEVIQSLRRALYYFPFDNFFFISFIF